MTIDEIFGDLPLLETEHLILCKATLDDAEDLYEYGSDPEVSERTTWATHASIDDSRAFLRSVIEQYEKGAVAPWALHHRKDHKLIGMCGYGTWDITHARAELGYAMAKPYWNHGLMTEAVTAMIAFGFLRMELNRIEARCFPENLASARVVEKVGMKYEGTLRRYAYAKGEYRDLKIYSILRSDWVS